MRIFAGNGVNYNCMKAVKYWWMWILGCEHRRHYGNVNFGSLRDINDNELVLYHCDKITHLDLTSTFPNNTAKQIIHVWRFYGAKYLGWKV